MPYTKPSKARRSIANTGFFALALTLAGTLYWVSSSREPRREATYDAGDSTTAVASTAIALAEPVSNADGDLPSSAPAPNAESRILPADVYKSVDAAQAFERAVALPVGHPDRESVLGLIGGLCRPSRQSTVETHFQDLVELRLIEGSDAARRAHAQWFGQMNAYCSGFDWSLAQVQRMADLDADVPELEFGPAADSRWLTGITNAAQKAEFLQDPGVVDEMWRIALTSDSPALVEHAMDLLAQTESGSFSNLEGLFPLGNRTGGTDHDHRLATRRAAGMVYSCRVFQHCSAGMLRAVAEIPRSDLVAGNLGVEGVLRNNLSPEQWRAVEVMLERLRSSRFQVHVEQSPGG